MTVDNIIPVHEIIRAMVPKLVKINEESIKPVYFKHDSPMALAKELSDMDQSTLKYKKYPLVALLHDFDENMNFSLNVHSRMPNLNILIANSTERDYDSDMRYEKNYKPILYPIYTSLIKNIEKSGLFAIEVGGVKHTKSDRLFWGRYGLYGRQGNIFNDYLDVVEIKNLNLSLTKNCYSKWQNLIQSNVRKRALETQD